MATGRIQQIIAEVCYWVIIMRKAVITAGIVLVFVVLDIFIYPRVQPAQWPASRPIAQKVIILGFDGVEPTLYEKWRDEGKLPNLKRLEQQGGYTHIATTFPAQSPVAWSTFATGNNPGKHNVFDFMIRDPRTYMPRIGMATVKQKKIGKPEIRSNQVGETFWETLSKNGIRSDIVRVPLTFPAKPVNGTLISGLGVPDVRGTIGSFSYYTTKKTSYIDNEMAYKLVNLPAQPEINTVIYGPQNKTVDLRIRKEDKRLAFDVQGNTFSLAKGQWSDFVRIRFNMLGPFVRIDGMARFYVEEVEPDIKVYLSPINFDPRNPFFDISYPQDYAAELANNTGDYKTLGWDIDTWALKENRISEDAFIQDLNSTLDSQEKILMNGLTQNNWNLYVQVFQSTDVIQHTFWRYMDKTHPVYENDPRYRDAILEVYRRMDRIVGKVLDQIGPDTTLIVMSDHGFKSFRRAVDLNAWLVDNGYMTLKDPGKRSDYLANVYVK